MERLPNYPLNMVIFFFLYVCPEQILKSASIEETGRNVCSDDKNTPL